VPAVTYLVHGEPMASSQLRDLMKKEFGWNVQVAEYMERVEVKYDDENRRSASDCRYGISDCLSIFSISAGSGSFE
jgi:hypothetical protein